MTTPTTIALCGCAFVAVQAITSRIGLRLRSWDSHDDDQQLAALTEPNPVTGAPENMREINRREMRT